MLGPCTAELGPRPVGMAPQLIRVPHEVTASLQGSCRKSAGLLHAEEIGPEMWPSVPLQLPSAEQRTFTGENFDL